MEIKLLSFNLILLDFISHEVYFLTAQVRLPDHFLRPLPYLPRWNGQSPAATFAGQISHRNLLPRQSESETKTNKA